jgi:hypothetical protein
MLAVARRLLGTEDAGRYLGVKAWSIRALITSGVLPAVRLPSPTGRPGRPSHRLLVDVLDLDALIARSKAVAREVASPEVRSARVARMSAARRRRGLVPLDPTAAEPSP